MCKSLTHSFWITDVTSRLFPWQYSWQKTVEFVREKQFTQNTECKKWPGFLCSSFLQLTLWQKNSFCLVKAQIWTQNFDPSCWPLCVQPITIDHFLNWKDGWKTNYLCFFISRNNKLASYLVSIVVEETVLTTLREITNTSSSYRKID